MITIETRFLTVTDAFLRDVGVDFRGLGGTNGGPLAVLDDVTSGLDDNASAGFDVGGPGVNQGAAALAPSSGLFFNDGGDGDFRGRTENIFTNPLGVWRDFKALGERLKEKKIDGNMVGDGLTLGGILVIGPKNEVLYQYKEETGKEIPTKEIADALARLADSQGLVGMVQPTGQGAATSTQAQPN